MDENQIEKIDLDKIDWRGSREFFESLGEALDKLDDKDESYDFTWVGKRKAIIEAGAPINKTLRPNVEASKNWDTTENLFIEGDNLDALKLLQESYLGKVKMIYIDPPYNTGKDFVYRDNFKASVEEYDDATEYKDETGNIQFKKNEKSNGRYHSDWLSMMYPRLKLARNLLTDDGVIFISIDDNEQSNLKKLCDEVFGEDNFIAQNTVIVRPEGIHYGGISKTHEYLLVYAKDVNEATFNEIEVEGAGFKFKDKISGFNLRDLRNQAPRIFNSTNRPNLRFPLWINTHDTDKDGFMEVSTRPVDGWEELLPPIIDGNESVYQWGKDKIKDEKENVISRRGSDGVLRVYQKRRTTTQKARTLWSGAQFITNRGTREVQSLFDGKAYFDFPKPLTLVERAIEIGADKNSITLDFFSGSSTSAHAVMKLNAEDGGSRKWVMVQYPEKTYEIKDGKDVATKEGRVAFDAGYKSIPEISRERIRRAGDKIAAEYPEAKVDYGFRALTITDTNYKEVYKSAGELEQSTLLDVVDNIKEDRSDLDLLYGVLTQSALELNRPIEKREIAGSDVYLYDYFDEVTGLIGCFSENVSEETIKEIAKLKPLTAVFRDSSFENSQAKVNLAEHFRILSPDTKVKVI